MPFLKHLEVSREEPKVFKCCKPISLESLQQTKMHLSVQILKTWPGLFSLMVNDCCGLLPGHLHQLLSCSTSLQLSAILLEHMQCLPIGVNTLWETISACG